MRIFLTAGLLTLLLSSCSSLFYTKYPNNDIRLGESKHTIVQKYGRPYSEELFSDNGVQTEVLTYKELMPYGYILNTSFYFQNDALVKKTQTDESPSKVVVKDHQ